jgi:hypothetical protein
MLESDYVNLFKRKYELDYDDRTTRIGLDKRGRCDNTILALQNHGRTLILKHRLPTSSTSIIG